MSRSGTTLLTTVLDSHSDISLGYELLPVDLPSPRIMIVNLEEAALELGKKELVPIGKILKNKGLNAEGLFAIRVARSGIEYEDYMDLLNQLIDKGYGKTESIIDRFKISYEVVVRKAVNESSILKGFKLNNASYELAHKLFPNSYYVYILRDPRDIWVSHKKRNFNRTVEDVSKVWVVYLDKFEKFSKKYFSNTKLIRYEDLVTNPKDTINNIFSVLPLDVELSVFEFYKSDATVHKAGHPNSEQLSQDFFTSSVSGWKNSITEEDIHVIEERCGKLMTKYDYLGD